MQDVKYVVKLGVKKGKELWMRVYPDGQMQPTSFADATRFGSKVKARWALKRERLKRRWKDAEILGTLTEKGSEQEPVQGAWQEGMQ